MKVVSKIEVQKALAAYRKKHGLIQSQLAEQLNVPRMTLYRWETGKTLPSPVFYRILCEKGVFGERRMGGVPRNGYFSSVLPDKEEE